MKLFAAILMFSVTFYVAIKLIQDQYEIADQEELMEE
jgi:hypothetical protein